MSDQDEVGTFKKLFLGHPDRPAFRFAVGDDLIVATLLKTATEVDLSFVMCAHHDIVFALAGLLNVSEACIVTVGKQDIPGKKQSEE